MQKLALLALAGLVIIATIGLATHAYATGFFGFIGPNQGNGVGNNFCPPVCGNQISNNNNVGHNNQIGP